MKQLSNYIAESLLDTEDEIFDRMDLNIFSMISNSKSENEFYEKLNELKDLCIAVNINDDLNKYKNSFFLMELMTTYNGKNYGIKIDKYFKKTKKPLFINFINYSKSGSLSISINNKHTFHELKYEYTPTLKSDTVYVFPKDIEEQYVEWVKSLTNRYLNFTEKSKVL
jgi:predicted Zn-dependent peptidase